MSVATEMTNEPQAKTIQIVTFRCGDVTLGIDIDHVQEINRLLNVTRVPGASEMIHGAVNLRGEVVTVIDLHRILQLAPSAKPERCRNLILNVGNERIGVLVDEVSDILTASEDDLSHRPGNVSAVDRQFIDSVYLREDHIVVILDSQKLFNAIEHDAEDEATLAADQKLKSK